MKRLTKLKLTQLLSICTMAMVTTPPAMAADGDPVARFVGHYRSGPGFPALAVRRMPVDLTIERGDGDIVVRFVDAYEAKIVTEIVYADSPSPFHLIEGTAGPQVATQSGSLRATGDLAMVQRSEIGQDGGQRHVRLLLHRHGDEMDLVALTSDGTGAIAVVSKTLLRLLPDDSR
jgi:hypothetical protein